jgi:hypothetical protein
MSSAHAHEILINAVLQQFAAADALPQPPEQAQHIHQIYLMDPFFPGNVFFSV